MYWNLLNRRTSTTSYLVPERCDHLVTGYSTKDHLLLDFDHPASLNMIARLIRMIQEEYKFLGDCLLALSSPMKHHAVFDSRTSWAKIVNVTEVLAGIGLLNRDYMEIRKFRKDLTLRISSVDRGLSKSAAPLPLAIVLCPHCRNSEIWPPKIRLDGLDLEGYQKLDNEPFSGFAEYLLALSCFRSLSGLEVQIL
jgi:hypothetical protein